MSKVARITNDGKMLIADEIIEYPPELEGGRNLWLKLSDIDLTDYVIGHNVEYPVNDRFNLIGYIDVATSRISLGNELKVVFSESDNAGVFVRGNIINLLPNTIYTLSYTLSHEGDMEGKRLYRLFDKSYYTSTDNGTRFSDVITTNDDGIFDFKVWQDNAGLSSMNITFTISDIKLEVGNKATPWTPSPEDLGFNYPNDIQYFNMGIKDKITEYPPELEGGRNLVVLSDIGNPSKVEVTNTGWIVRDSYSTTLNSNFHVKLEPDTEYTVSYEMEIIEQGDTTNSYPGRLAITRNNPYLLITVGNSNTTKVVDSFITDDLGGLGLTCYGSLGGVVEFKNVKIEKGNKATSWTPSPEDLGLEYSDDIQYFNTKDKILMINELIEVDNKFKVSQILENGDFRNGLQGWNFNSVQNDSIIIENGILKFTTDGTTPYTINGNLDLGHPLEITHKYYGFANVKYIGTMRLKATTYYMEERENNGEWIKLSGLITSGGTFNRPFGIVIMDKVPTDVEVKDLFFINLTETFGEGNEPSKDVCDKMFSNYYQNGGYAELINDNVISLKDGNLLVNELIEGGI